MLLENVLLCIKSPTTHEHIRLAYGRFRVGKCYVNYRVPCLVIFGSITSINLSIRCY